jgi:vancomycin resistance protein YoaR
MTETKETKKKIHLVGTWASVALVVLLVVVLLITGAAVSYAKMYQGKVFPGVQVFGVHLDGLNKDEARTQVQNAVDAALAKGLRFSYKGKEVSLDTSSVAADPDASRDLVDYDVEPAIEEAFGYGRDGNWIQDLQQQLRARVVPLNVHVGYTLDRAAIEEGVQSAFAKDIREPKDAELVFVTSTGAWKAEVKPEEQGTVLVVEPALDELEKQAKNLAFAPIPLSDKATEPTRKKSDLEPFIGKAEEILARPALTFTYGTQKFPMATSTVASWLVVTGTANGLDLVIDPTAFEAHLRKIAPEIEVEAKNGSLEVKDGKIVSFIGGQQGQRINGAMTLAAVEKDWPPTSTFPLIVDKVESTLVGADPERLGIKELLGVGHSNFSGSPSNRRKNIALGIERVNGTIIEPDQEFSLLTVLGPVDGTHGWLPELVIKGNETKPEYGGGLCQIGTTTFRGALASGLPILERRNHSYRVRYYEPAGTDATIYEPKPDFRFKNDTGHPILINAYKKGDDISFEFWGTKDGRKAETTTPRVYNITSPPPMKLIETTTLAPGVKKCTESAHAGADAEFTYTVTYANGETKTEVFKSHYRPWQAVCLVGVTTVSPGTLQGQ